MIGVVWNNTPVYEVVYQAEVMPIEEKVSWKKREKQFVVFITPAQSKRGSKVLSFNKLREEAEFDFHFSL